MAACVIYKLIVNSLKFTLTLSTFSYIDRVAFTKLSRIY